jgi:trigger factor
MDEKDIQNVWHHVVTVDNLSGVKRKITIVFDSIGTRMAIDKSCDLLIQNVQIKGFRKGKAPKSLVEKFYRKEIEKSAAQGLITEGFLHACYEHKISPLTEPKIEKSNFNIDGTFTCEILVDQKPTFTPVGYVGMQLEKPKVNVEELCAHMLEDQRGHFSCEVQKEEVGLSDVVSIDFIAVGIDGKEVSSGKEQRFLISAGQPAPFGENLIGMKVGETRESETVLPGNDSREPQTIKVMVILKSVVKIEKPSDEDLANKMGISSVEEMKNIIIQQAQNEAQRRFMQILEESAVDKLAELNEFEVPEEWEKDEEKYILQQINVKEPDDELLKYVSSMARRNVRRTFILDSIYDAEPNLKVTQEDVDEVIKAEAEKKGVSTIVVKDEIKKNKMVDAVFGMIKNKKVMSFILNQAQIVDSSVPQTTNIQEGFGG